MGSWFYFQGTDLMILGQWQAEAAAFVIFSQSHTCCTSNTKVVFLQDSLSVLYPYRIQCGALWFSLHVFVEIMKVVELLEILDSLKRPAWSIAFPAVQWPRIAPHWGHWSLCKQVATSGQTQWGAGLWRVRKIVLLYSSAQQGTVSADKLEQFRGFFVILT